MNDQKKVAVITGAAHGIGRRTAELFVQQRYLVALIDLKSLAEVAHAAGQHDTDLLALTGDISREEVVTGFAREVQKMGPRRCVGQQCRHQLHISSSSCFGR
jgi:NAD(P)-dependent dehydrogenase (short-subunit alcohol dehydrogenase family)